ncbi:hypothetical protein Bbelb_286050 [Branchiostoma belcheri]|nr:hypothetical protein Bbelb_286050 [Branchiostoma belcheri]
MAAGGFNAGTELDAAFDIIQSDLGDDWIDLGLALGLKYNIVEEMVNRSPTIHLIWRNRTMLEKWRQQEGKQATVQELLHALKKIKRQDLVDRLKDKYTDLHDADPQLQKDVTEKCRLVETVSPPLSDISTGFSSSPPKQYSTEDSVSSPRSKQGKFEYTTSVPSTATSSSQASESSKGTENKKVKRKTVKKTKKVTKGKQGQQNQGHSSDPKFVLNAVSSMQLAKQKRKECYYLVVKSSVREELLEALSQIDGGRLDLCKEIILKLCKDFDIGEMWSSSICVQMFPKTDESIGELNRYQESGKLAADLQTEFENIGLNCPLEVDVLSMEELEEEVEEIVEEAMDVFVLSETQEPGKDSEESTQTQETGEESTQTYEELRDAWRDALLRITAWTGDEDKVKTLLQAGVQVNTENSEGETPLWDAVRGGHANIVTLLLQKGADLGAGANTASGIGQTLLQLAAQSGNAEIVGMLTKAEADLDKADDEGRTPLFLAAESGNAEMVSILIQAGADLNKADSMGRTPLWAAAENGHAEVVSILIQAGADLDTAGVLGRTPLWVAAKRKHAEVVGILIQAGADLNNADDEGRTALWAAAEKGHAEVVSVLIQAGADLDQANSMEETPLWVAAWSKHAEIVSILTQAGADLNKADIMGRTPLWVVVESKGAEIVSILIQAGADLNKSNKDEQTPLWTAAHCGNMEVVKVLIEAGADISKPDKTGKTPYQVAIETKHSDVAKVIEEGQS